MQSHTCHRGLGTSIIPVSGVRPGSRQNRAYVEATVERAAEADHLPLWIVVPAAAAVSLIGWTIAISAAFGLVRAMHFF